MRVVLEVNSVLTNRYSGFLTYGAGLLEGMAELTERPDISFFCGSKAFAHKDWLALSGIPPKKDGYSREAQWHVCRLKPRHLGIWWRKARFPALQYFTGPFDLYHCNHHLMPPTKGRPRLLTVHDLRRYRYPHFYPHSKKGPFENAVRRADHFIAISQATKSDLREFFNIDDERIDVVYHGGPLRRYQECTPKTSDDKNSLLKQFHLQPGRYFTAMASYDKRKNLPNLVQAFFQAAKNLPDDYQLVIIGEPPRREDVFSLDEKADLTKRVIFTGSLDDFSALLTQSTALVYVSFYEGFGLPILEAMSAGTVVITSNCSSMPEVAGEAAMLVDPNEMEDIAEAMKKVAVDAELRTRLVTAGRKRSREFSWQRAAAETVAVYKKLI